MTHAWLLDPLYPKILTPNPTDDRWTMVSDLIDMERKVWKEDVVKEVLGFTGCSEGECNCKGPNKRDDWGRWKVETNLAD